MSKREIGSRTKKRGETAWRLNYGLGKNVQTLDLHGYPSIYRGETEENKRP